MDELTALVRAAEKRVDGGYYTSCRAFDPGPSLRDALISHPTFPIIAEVKLASPSAGTISAHRPRDLVSDYVGSGAAALSVLTEPERFQGSLGDLVLASATGLPTLMKDFVVAEEQVNAGASGGASAVLLIQEVFDRVLPEDRRNELIAHAHDRGLEVLLEAGSQPALEKASISDADILGINQRDLSTFVVDTGKAARLLPSVVGRGRPVVVMSGITDQKAVEEARDNGADAVLVGSALSSSPEPGRTLQMMRVRR